MFQYLNLKPGNIHGTRVSLVERKLLMLQGANASYAGVSGLMGGPGSAGSVMPVVQAKLQKMVQTNR